MSHSSTEIVTQIHTDDLAIATPTARLQASTKDAGRVKVGAVNISFKPANSATKDAGRVRLGAVNIRF